MRHDYPGYHGVPSVCDLQLAVAADGPATVVCTEHPDNGGTSVTNRAEHLATRLVRQNAAIDPTRLTWIEHYPERGRRLYRRPPTWSVVTFKVNAASRVLRHPDWRYVDRETAAALLRNAAGAGLDLEPFAKTV